MNDRMGNTVHQVANLIGCWVVSLILLMAFYEQLKHGEPPCPLCLLQRICFVAVGLGLLANVCYGVRNSHYGILLCSSLLGVVAATRQILLHIVPGDSGFGAPLRGIHLYTHSAIAFFIIALCVGVALLIESGTCPKPVISKGIRNVTAGFFLLIILANVVSVFLECGFKECPDDPVNYLLLQ